MDFIYTIISWLNNNYVEVIASVAGIIGVWLTAKQNIWCWPVGVVNILFSALVFYSVHLYAAVILQVFYLVTTVYGWYKWNKGTDTNSPLPVIRLGRKGMLIIPLVLIVSVSLGGYLLEYFTDASLAYLDSFTTVGGIICTYLTARKIIESWVIWMFIDAVSTGIYLYKGLYAFAILYFIFCLMAFYGYSQWKKDLKTKYD